MSGRRGFIGGCGHRVLRCGVLRSGVLRGRVLRGWVLRGRVLSVGFCGVRVSHADLVALLEVALEALLGVLVLGVTLLVWVGDLTALAGDREGCGGADEGEESELLHFLMFKFVVV